ncbi:MAG: helix-turn-helix transcriptional regulator [Saccharofermentanales bacterium]
MIIEFGNRQCHISEMSFSKQVGAYQVDVKVGNYYEFNNYKLSNQRHFHDCYELVIVLDGSGYFSDEGMIQELEPGDLFLSEPFQDHEIHISQTESLVVFYLFFTFQFKHPVRNPSFEEQLISRFLENHRAFAKNHRNILAYFYFIEGYRPKLAKRDPWITKAVTDLLLNSMAAMTIQQSVGPDSLVQHEVGIFEVILDYIDQNVTGKITASSISEAVCISKSSLYKLFNQHLNRTVHDYIKERKIDLAKHYLSMNLNATEVAELVGLGSLSYFSRTFKNYTRMSPREFIKSNPPSPLGYGRRY